MKNGKIVLFLMFAVLAAGPSQATAQDTYHPYQDDYESECSKRDFQVILDDPYEDQHTLTGRFRAPHPHYSYDLYMASEPDENGTLKGKLVLHAHEGKSVGQLAYVYIDEVIIFPEGSKEIWIKVDKDFVWGANNYRGDIDMSDYFFCLNSYRTDDNAKEDD